MDPSIWELQQEAARRVEQMQQTSRRIASQRPYPPAFSTPPRRTAASMRAHRPPPYTAVRENHNLPRTSQNLPPTSSRGVDREQLLLLLLTLFLIKSDASPTLILALLYLAL